MSFNDKLIRFSQLLEHEQKEELKKRGLDSPGNLEDCKVSIKPSKKYTKVDVGTSGKYMIDQDGNIFGIKGYGVIHKGHCYGTLDTINQYYWGTYTAEPKQTMSIYDMSLLILRNTNDGNDLDPSDLYLLQEAINNNLTQKGIEVFTDLYERLKKGKYTKPFLCGIDPFTIDHDGNVYYNDKRVEHFNYWDMSRDEMKKELIPIKRRCQYLESIGVELSTITAIWKWEEYQPKGWCE